MREYQVYQVCSMAVMEGRAGNLIFEMAAVSREG